MDHSYSVFTMKIHESCVVTQCKISYIDGQVPKLKIFEQKDLKEKIFATGIPYDRIANSPSFVSFNNQSLGRKNVQTSFAYVSTATRLY